MIHTSYPLDGDKSHAVPFSLSPLRLASHILIGGGLWSLGFDRPAPPFPIHAHCSPGNSRHPSISASASASQYSSSSSSSSSSGASRRSAHSHYVRSLSRSLCLARFLSHSHSCSVPPSPSSSASSSSSSSSSSSPASHTTYALLSRLSSLHTVLTHPITTLN